MDATCAVCIVYVISLNREDPLGFNGCTGKLIENQRIETPRLYIVSTAVGYQLFSQVSKKHKIKT